MYWWLAKLNLPPIEVPMGENCPSLLGNMPQRTNSWDTPFPLHSRPCVCEEQVGLQMLLDSSLSQPSQETTGAGLQQHLDSQMSLLLAVV